MSIHAIVRELRLDVAERLANLARADMSDGERRLLGRQLTLEAIDEMWTHRMDTLPDIVHGGLEDEIVEAVMASLFGLGRLQTLIDNPEIENVDVNGHDGVWVTYADGTKLRAEPIADSDDEMIQLIRTAAARLGLAERRFDSGKPELDLRLPDGSRLSAVMSVCERPCLSVRRHRYTDLDLDILVGMGMLPPEVADMLSAAVRARRNIIVSGAMNAGKTTLLRGLASAIPPRERIVTIEQALELGLDKMNDRHPDCVALEARESNTEGEGEIGMARLVRRSLRMDADRVIVGEVLGDEVIPMLNAMSQGRSGSMCTIHADSSAGVFRRIASQAAQASERLSLEAVNLLIAGSIHFVVHIDARYERGFDDDGMAPTGVLDGGELSFLPARLIRRVASVREVVDADGAQVLSNEIWRPDPDEGCVPGAPLQARTIQELMDHGYEPLFVAESTEGLW